MTLLAATGLCMGRGDRQLLSDLNFSLAAGDVLHIRGRNGAGKSSLIEVLAGLRPQQAGQLKRPEASQVHWLGHRNGLNADLSISENLSSWCALNAVKADAMPVALERMGLSRLRHRYVRTLSAGQKRRAALARLLLVQRPLWLLDEPLSGLDAEGTRLLGDLLNEHVMAEGAVLITSHQALPGRLPRVSVIDLA